MKKAAKKAVKKAARRKSAAPATLEAVLAVADPDPWQAQVAFMDAAARWVSDQPVHGRVPYEALPEPLHMILAVNAAMLAISSAGLAYLFDWELGGEYHAIEAWLRRIGAGKTAAYLAAGAALCPGGRVPEDQGARMDLTALWEGMDPDPLVALDDRHRDEALGEIPDRLRAWLAANRAAVERAAAEAT